MKTFIEFYDSMQTDRLERIAAFFESEGLDIDTFCHDVYQMIVTQEPVTITDIALTEAFGNAWGNMAGALGAGAYGVAKGAYAGLKSGAQAFGQSFGQTAQPAMQQAYQSYQKYNRIAGMQRSVDALHQLQTSLQKLGIQDRHTQIAFNFLLRTVGKAQQAANGGAPTGPAGSPAPTSPAPIP